MIEWTPARKKAFIVSVLRSGTKRYPPKFQTLNDAKTLKKVNPQTKRVAQHYKCNSCLNDFPLKQVQVDHIIPVVGSQGFTTWDSFINNLFCEKENLQVLCINCHGSKTKTEREKQSLERKESRKV